MDCGPGLGDDQKHCLEGLVFDTCLGRMLPRMRSLCCRTHCCPSSRDSHERRPCVLLPTHLGFVRWTHYDTTHISRVVRLCARHRVARWCEYGLCLLRNGDAEALRFVQSPSSEPSGSPCPQTAKCLPCSALRLNTCLRWSSRVHPSIGLRRFPPTFFLSLFRCSTPRRVSSCRVGLNLNNHTLHTRSRQ